jgi:hypothetical protein
MARELQAALNAEPAPSTREEAGLTCGCCFDEYAVGGIVQCEMGHLFCHGCVEAHAKEQLFGKGVTAINCMCCQAAGPCRGVFPDSQLALAIGGAALALFERKLAENCVAMAALPNAVSAGYHARLIGAGPVSTM